MYCLFKVHLALDGEVAIAHQASLGQFWKATRTPPITALAPGDRLKVDYSFDWKLGGDPRIALQAIKDLLVARGPKEIQFDLKELRRVLSNVENLTEALKRLEEVAERF